MAINLGNNNGPKVPFLKFIARQTVTLVLLSDKPVATYWQENMDAPKVYDPKVGQERRLPRHDVYLAYAPGNTDGGSEDFPKCPPGLVKVDVKGRLKGAMSNSPSPINTIDDGDAASILSIRRTGAGADTEYEISTKPITNEVFDAANGLAEWCDANFTRNK